MTPALQYVVCSAALTWLSLMLGTFFRNRLWTLEGMKVGVGNRDKVSPATPLAGRADRAAINTLENFVLFAALVLTAHAAGVDGEHVTRGAAIFFWARVAYVPVYLAGIPVLRTLLWAIGLAGMGLIVAAMF